MQKVCAYALSAVVFYFSAITASACTTIDEIEAFQASVQGPVGARCTVYVPDRLQSGTSCHWEFAFRDEEANNHATALADLLEGCRLVTELPSDQPVNHPDSFGLRQWQADGSIYRVSVKDKGGLNRTFVFFSVEGQ